MIYERQAADVWFFKFGLHYPLACGLAYEHLMLFEAVETITCALPRKPDACLAMEAYGRNTDCDRSYANLSRGPCVVFSGAVGFMHFAKKSIFVLIMHDVGNTALLYKSRRANIACNRKFCHTQLWV